MAYCGTELVRYLAQVQPSQFKELTDEAKLNAHVVALITSAQLFLDDYCNHDFSSTLEWFKLDGNGKDFLMLPPKYSPLISITNGSLNSVALDTTKLKVHDQFVDYEGGNFTSGKLNVVFQATHGYASVPSSIEFVCASLCSNVLVDMVRKNMVPDMFMQILESGSGGVSSLWASPSYFTPPLKDMCDKYRIHWVDLG